MTCTTLSNRSAGAANLQGVVCMLLSIALFSIMDAMIKGLSSTYGTMQIVFFRSLFGLVPLAMVLLRDRGLSGLKTRRPFSHALRAALGVSAMVCFFYALGRLPLADAYTLSFSAPLFVTALSGPLLAEPVGWRRWAAVLAGLAGILVMLRPGAGMWSAPGLICLAGALFYALALLQTRRLSRTDANVTIVLYVTLASALLSASLMGRHWIAPASIGDLAMLAMLGILGSCAQLLITQAFRLAPAASVAPLEYSAMIWGVVLGWLFFQEVPGVRTVIGGLIVLGSGLYVLRQETRPAETAASWLGAEIPTGDSQGL